MFLASTTMFVSLLNLIVKVLPSPSIVCCCLDQKIGRQSGERGERGRGGRGGEEYRRRGREEEGERDIGGVGERSRGGGI